MNVGNMVFFNIKNFTVVSFQEVKNRGYIKMVDGLWYKYINEGDGAKEELDIVVNFLLNFEIKEDEYAKNSHNLLKSMSRLSGEKSNLSLLIPKLKEKGKLLRQLLENYQDGLEERVVNEEKSNLLNELHKAREDFQSRNKEQSQNKVKLKDVQERLNILYKDLKDKMDEEEFEKELDKLKDEQQNLLMIENQCKIDIEVLKEDITYYSKQLRKPLTNIEIEKRTKRDETYRSLMKQIITVANVLEYVERLDKAQDEKSLVVRGIKSVLQNDWATEKNTINFS